VLRQRRGHLYRAETAGPRRHPGGGGGGPEPALDSATILLKEITVRGSYIYIDEFDRAVHLLATQQVTVADLTTVISPLPDALTAFDALRAGQIMKALIAPRGSSLAGGPPG